MKCRQCAAEIAEKAIVCYRCGTPTADLPSPQLQVRPSGRRVWVWVLIIVALAAGAVAVYFQYLSAPTA